MGEFIRENGRKAKCRVLESLFGQMVRDIKEVTLIIRRVGLVNFTAIQRCTKGFGSRGNPMGRVK